VNLRYKQVVGVFKAAEFQGKEDLSAGESLVCFIEAMQKLTKDVK